MDRRFGEMKDARILHHFFGHVQRNRTGEFEEAWPWVSYRLHERYYLRSAPSGSAGDPEELGKVSLERQDGGYQLRENNFGMHQVSIDIRRSVNLGA